LRSEKAEIGLLAFSGVHDFLDDRLSESGICNLQDESFPRKYPKKE
jgi:hypothetical protein